MLHLLDTYSLPSDINYLLYGSTALTDDDNTKIFKTVQNYI